MTGILALDLGISTGWSTPERSGEIKFRSQGSTLAHRHRGLFANFGRWLPDMIDRYRPDMLLLEAPYLDVRHPSAPPVLYGLRAVALHIAYLRDLEAREVEPRKWQAWARHQGWAKGKASGSHARDASYMRRWFEEEG